MESTRVEGADGGPGPPYVFDVFLSYSRRDRDFAARLEEALERYTLPKGLGGDRRTLNVFRDEADIEAAEDYYRTIEQHLKGARKLLVVCSPDARSSRYVEDEIRRFIETHSRKDIVPILVRGRANNETSEEGEKAFPDILCEDSLPLAADFVGYETRRGRLDKGQFRNSWYSVLSAISGIDRRRLEQVDERARARRRAVALVAASALILVLSVALFFAVTSRRQAVGARNEAFARELAANATAQLPFNPELGLLLAIEAAKRGEMVETENALRLALSRSPRHILHTSATDSLSNSTGAFGRGGRLVVAANDKTVWAFDAVEGRTLFERRHDLYAADVAVNPGGNFVAVALDPFPPEAEVNFEQDATGPGTVLVYEADTGKELRKLETTGGGAGVFFSPDDKFLLTPGERSQVWEVGTWRVAAEVRGWPSGFSGDGRVLLTKSTDSGDRLFVTDLTTGRRLAEIPTMTEGTDGPIFGALSHDGKHVAAAAAGPRLRLHEASGGRVIRELKLDGAERPSVPQFSPDGRFVAFAVGGKVFTWEPGSGRKRELGQETKPLFGLSFSPDGRHLLAVNDSARLHDLHSGRVLAEFRANSSSSVNGARFSPDGMTVLTSNTDGTIFLWDLSFRKAGAILEAGANPAESFTARAAFSPDAKLVATVRVSRDQPEVVQVWELASGKIWTFTHDRVLTGVAFSPDGMQILTTDDRAAQLRQTGDGRVVSEFPHGEDLTGASYCPDGRLIVTTGSRTLKVWDLSSGRVVHEMPSGIDESDGLAALSPDGGRVLLTARGRAQVWEVGGVRPVLELNPAARIEDIQRAVYSHDGNYILTWGNVFGGFSTSTVQVRDADTGHTVAELNGHVDIVQSATLDPTGRYVLTTSGFSPSFEDGDKPPEAANATRVWDLMSGQTFYDFRDAGGEVLAGIFAPSAKSLLAIDDSGMVFTYSCELCAPQRELLALALKRHFRRLTPDERARYLREPRGD